MKYLFSILLSLSLYSLKAQFYYNDVIGTVETNARMSLLVSQQIGSISATGFDERGAKNTDFNEWQEIGDNGRLMKVTTRNKFDKNTVYYRFDAQQRLLSVTDSTDTGFTQTLYTYQANNNYPISVKTTTSDKSQEFDDTETHLWEYGSDGLPEKMWRIKNSADTTEFRFGRDEKGKVADEQLYRKGKKFGDPIYYYYTDNGMLSDIVRYDKYEKMLLPETLFEYDAAGRLAQKMVVTSNRTRDYMIWRYAYNTAGLRTKEVLFDKNKKQTGRIDYAYSPAK
ncbi:MAG: adaptor protein MecA [Terrimonas ferruginea]|uniref:adaptor protein MecA n=1 Tax=Terrimonas ferruginea TaxID=249 RepID=UPI00092B9060|nr:adaptor protein MecA [Terrimonas ferruginea]MBN8783749.1 adaptor protein MecA [Terrimonas ferruginea]OJW40798.1 MAG: hypothetical protein BGO56_08175 [Sphingobacteriales bacterium 48-107]